MKPLVYSFLAGLVAACGFQPLGLWPLTLIALAALPALVASAPGLRSALARGWWFGLGYFALGLNWIATAFTYQAAMPAWLGWVAVVLLSLYLAVFPAAAAGLAWRWGRGDKARLIVWLAAASIVTEWLRATLLTGFPWNPLGVALLPTFVARWAVLIGTYGVSGIAVLLGGAILLCLGGRWRPAAMIAIPVLAGAALIMSFPATPGPGGPDLRIVQPDLGQEEKWRPEEIGSNLASIMRLSAGGPHRPRLLLWPEVAVARPLEDQLADPGFKAEAEALRRQVASVLGPGDLLLTGGVTWRSADGSRVTSSTNSIFAIDPHGRILARYDKSHLVPYGEYLPMRPLMSRLGLSRLAPGDVDFAFGPGPRTFDLPLAGKVGMQICYEIVFSGEVVDRAHRPSFVFNPSNDAWFGRWGPPQHLAQARMRALEEALPIVRATPTGISAVIDSKGRLLASLPWHGRGVIDATLPAAGAPTLFARFGNFLPLLFALLLAAAAIALPRKRS
jgi:apolipoprotein N-acyltransferase